MGLFDNLGGLVQGVMGEQPSQGEPQQGAMGILGSLLQQGERGQSGNIVSSLLGGFGGQGAAPQNGQAPAARGGMAGMLETLAANGLADHVGSWLGGGHNLPISPEQIQSALGSQQAQQLAASSGLPIGDFLQHLSQHLPQAAAEAAGTADNG